MINQKGDFILYIIFTIVILLIGAILFYIYINPSTDEDYLSKIKDSNFIGEFKSKQPLDVEKEVYPNSYKFNAKLELDIKLELNNKDLIINGKPNINFSERYLIAEDPKLIGFTGYIDNSGIYGGVKAIKNESFDFNLNSTISSNFENINSIFIDELYLDLEKTNLNGTINVQERTFNLNKAYIKLNGFLGTANVKKDNDKVYVELDGNIGYIKIVDNSLETILK